METASQVESLLHRHFQHFESSLIQKLSQNASLKTFPQGEVILQTGQYFKSTMLVVKGRIKLYREDEEGNEFFMYFLEPGQACALSMICATRHETSQITAIAVEETEVIQIPLVLMDELMRHYKSWYYFVLETYRSRFEELLIVIDQIAFKGMDDRLFFYLKNQFEVHKTKEINITHQQIATDLNSSREVISRLLKKMEQNGMILLNRSSIERKKM